MTKVAQKTTEAAPLYERVMSVNEALALARDCLAKRNYDEAARIAQQIADHKRGHPDAFHILAMAAFQTGRIDKAIGFAERAVGRAPRTAGFWSNLAEMLRRRGLLTRAQHAAARAVKLDPLQAQGWHNLSAIEYERRNFVDAEAACRMALKLEPERASSWNALGNALQRQLRDAEAHDAFARALTLRPDFVDAMVNDALCWRDAGDLTRALRRLNEVLTLSPNHANAHVIRALVYALKGDVARARVEYEWRLALPGTMPEKLKGKRWRGEDISGKRLLLFAEQGLGDVIQSLRYISQLRARGVTDLVLCVPRNLRGLVEENFSDLEIVTSVGAVARVDYHCALMSLPLLVEGMQANEVPQEAYLAAAPARVEAWRKRFESVQGRKIGLVWAGNTSYQSDYMRSMSASMLKPLFDLPDFHFFSLQIGPASTELTDLKGQVEDLGPQVATMADAAAAISVLDLVISVDTSLAHLAGALGRSVWTMLPLVPDWRWGMGHTEDKASAASAGELHPLYATARLFRQKDRGDWAGVIGDIRARLQQA